MKIPEHYYAGPDSLRRLVEMAEKLLEQVQFPRRRYDDDVYSLIEDVIQEMFCRILGKEEPENSIVKWPAFFYRVLYYIILERRDRAFQPHEAGREKASGATLLETGDEDSTRLEEQVADRADPVDLAMQYAELPELDESGMCVIDARFWRIVDEELRGIADKQSREYFREFVILVWRQGLSRRAAWKQANASCCSRANFCRWLKELGLTVMKRWGKGENQAGGGL